MDSNKLVALVDGQGDRCLVKDGRQFDLDTHNRVVEAIHARARHIANGRVGANARGYGSNPLWEATGQTEPDPAFRELAVNPVEIQQASVAKQAGIGDMEKGLLEVHGTYPGAKPEGVCRILYENANGIDCRNFHHPKVMKARRIHDSLEADMWHITSIG